jgi:hypothetical protein
MDIVFDSLGERERRNNTLHHWNKKLEVMIPMMTSTQTSTQLTMRRMILLVIIQIVHTKERIKIKKLIEVIDLIPG